MLKTALLLLALSPLTDDHPAPTGLPEGVVAHRGHVLCLDQELERLDDRAACNEPGAARFGLETTDGATLYFLPDDPQAGLFLDPVVRGRELEVQGWPRPEGHLEIHTVYSIKGGKRHHIHYRCDVCNITAKAPGPCWCCQQPFELREMPVEDGESPPPRSPGFESES